MSLTSQSMSNFGLYRREHDSDSCGTGFVCKIDGTKSHQIVSDGLLILKNLEHRGAASSDPLAGDGAGIMTQVPHLFFSSIELNFTLPENGEYAAGNIFMPKSAATQAKIKAILEKYTLESDCRVLGWREVPIKSECLSKNMLYCEPSTVQFFVAKHEDGMDRDEFERKLCVIRRQAENEVRLSDFPDKDFFYICSLSANTIVYKGMFLAFQLEAYYPDLTDENYESCFSLVHQRYSTNTFPSWGLAHPFRFLAHNGEINTIQGNINWTNSRECVVKSELFGADLTKLFPMISPEGSDTSSLDNLFEVLHLAGRSMDHTMCLLVPEAWEMNPGLDPKVRAFLEYNSALTEPWDGPAAVCFSNGYQIGAALDRNGLRPLRYTKTRNGLFVMASETGVLEIPEEDIEYKGKLKPGNICMIDFEEGDVYFNDKIKDDLAKLKPYQSWLDQNMILLRDLHAPPAPQQPEHEKLRLRQRVFGFSYEEIHMLIKHMAEKGEEVVVSMGNDTPLAVLSDRPKRLFMYFKQRFAQVTNPPIDSIREEHVMSLRSNVGGGYNLLEDVSENCKMLVIEQPILNNLEIKQLLNNKERNYRSASVSICYDFTKSNLEKAIDALNQEAEELVDEGYKLLILSDRDFSESRVPIPVLLATSTVHNHLIRVGKRGKVGIIVESGEAREVHHFAMLIGYGAGAICPYLAFETIEDLRINEHLSDDILKQETLRNPYYPIENYIKAIQKGLKKIFAKMGISTLLSYQGAQIFEAIGINQSVIDKHFTGTRTSIQGIDLEIIEKEMLIRHKRAFAQESTMINKLITGGEYMWRSQGEVHAYNPETVHLLQQCAWKNDQALYDQFAEIVNNQNDQLYNLRGLIELKHERKSIPLSEVESEEAIMKRFVSGAMSIGAISREAHEDLAVAMNNIGGKSNTGEGGEDEIRFKPDKNGILKRSRIKQIASGRFGVTSSYLVNADEIQIKVAQGAKPGEGGQLPGHKVDEYIAFLRHTIPGVSLISPPPHHDIYSIEDLSQLIFDLKNSNPEASISVKLVSSFGVGTVAAGVAKAKADQITISGYEGGTGATPATSMKHAGIPWEVGLAETQQTLVANNLRGQVRLQVDGQLKTGRDVIIAAAMGAEEFGFATSALIALGCIMMRKCHLNTCPVGIATQNKYLRGKYHGKPEYVVNYLRFIAKEARQLLADIGYRSIDEIVGRVEILDTNKVLSVWNEKKVDLSPLFYNPAKEGDEIRCLRPQNHGIDKVLDVKLIEQSKDAIFSKHPISIESIIRNSDRTVGTMLGSNITYHHGSEGLPDNTITVNLKGTAGQSFGAFIPKGLKLQLEGDANDYVGKGLSGGTIIIRPSTKSKFKASKNVIVGNTVLYGATSGKAYFNGKAGERFAVRNSGATTVVEGVGDHCCEYMTGGVVVVLGETGVNFGAGMSGGVAYVYDRHNNFRRNCNISMIDIEDVTDITSKDELHSILKDYFDITKSERAKLILDTWKKSLEKFVKVIPMEFRKVIQQRQHLQKSA